MIRAVRSTALALLLTPALALSQQQQQPAPPPEPPGKEGLDYVILHASSMNYSSIGPANTTAETQSVGLALGTYITDRFKVELRAGGEIADDRASYAYIPGGPSAGDNPQERRAYLDMSMPFYVSWYMGALYPWSDFSHIYGQFGFSYVSAEAETETPGRFESISEDLYDTHFSTSWLIGIDFQVIENAYFLLEGGRLHTDSVTDINTMQYSAGLRYEF